MLISSLAISAFAQSFGFQKDEDNDAYVSGTFSYDCTKKTAWNRLVSYVNTIYVAEGNEINVNEKNLQIVVTGCRENSKVRVNPLSGAYTDNIHYTLTLALEDSSKVSYSFTKLSINTKAMGIVNYNKFFSVRSMLKDYERTIEQLEDDTLSKKERKELQNKANDLDSSLSKAYEVLVNRSILIKNEIE